MRANGSIPSLQAEEARFVSYTLGDLLPDGDKLIIDRELRILTQVRAPDGMIIEQQRFTDNEYYLLIEILSSFPYYCPHEQLLSAQTGRPLERCRKELERAAKEGDMDMLIRPVRNTLSRVRVRVRPFSIDIQCILDTGYILMKDNPLRRPSL